MVIFYLSGMKHDISRSALGYACDMEVLIMRNYGNAVNSVYFTQIIIRLANVTLMWRRNDLFTWTEIIEIKIIHYQAYCVDLVLKKNKTKIRIYWTTQVGCYVITLIQTLNNYLPTVLD